MEACKQEMRGIRMQRKNADTSFKAIGFICSYFSANARPADGNLPCHRSSLASSLRLRPLDHVDGLGIVCSIMLLYDDPTNLIKIDLALGEGQRHDVEDATRPSWRRDAARRYPGVVASTLTL